MNKRIKKLINEATSGHEQEQDRSKVMTVSDKELEIFAQLIVAECASIVDTYGRWILYDKLAVKIKQHFGVTYD
jgi:hypothetical protein